MQTKDTAPMELTEKERNHILAIRRLPVANGRIPCIIYKQDGKLVRTEFKMMIESVKL